ncbi:MAG: peptidylprolyl isomerase [Spirochaetaceae bacterium]
MASEEKKKRGGDSEPRTRISTRRPFLYLFSVIVLVIIVVTFIGAPLVTETAGRSGRLVFGSYRGEEIAYAPGNYFARQYQQIAAQVRDQGESSDLQGQLREVWRQAFNQTLFHTAVMQEAEQSGLVISESRVDREIARHPQFQENGSFSAEAYRETSSQERFSLRTYLREQAVQERYIEDKLQAIKTSPSETEFVKSMASPERRFRYVAFDYSDYPREEAVGFAEDNPELFQRVSLSVITITGDEAEAERIREQIANRESTFEEMARAHSADRFAETGGDMGRRYFYELEPDLEDTEQLEQVFALSQGELSPVVEARNGWLIYRVDQAARPIDLDNEDAVADVRSYLNTFERGRIEDYMARQAAAFREAAAESDFENAADARGLSVNRTGFFPINYGNLPVFGRVNSEESDVLSRAAFRESFFVTAFGLERGSVSQPVTLRNALVVLQLDEEREASEDAVSFLDSYYPFLVQQYQSEELQRTLLDPQYYEDDFARAFSRVVRGSS